jgi:hypothetical protein
VKKIYLLLAVATVSLFAFSACNKRGGDTPGDKEIVMKDGPSKQEAKVVKFKNNLPKYKDPNGSYEITKMEFTEGKMLLLERRVVPSKADVGDIINQVFSFSGTGGNYDVIGLGTVTISGSNVTVNFYNGGESGSFEATITPTTTSTVAENNFARSWKINNIVLSVSGKGVSIMKSFNGCNLEEIGKYAADNGVSGLKDRLPELMGYNVEHVIFTGADSFIVTFTGANAIAGTFKLSGSDKLNYSFPVNNPFFHGSANGTFEFPADQKVTVTLNADIEGYSGSIEMSMTASY